MDDTILNFNYPTDTPKIIKVIGVGGGGGNAVTHMYKEGIHDVTFVLCNTDNQALNRSDVPIKLLLGREITQGLGAGNKPERAMMAAEESLDDLRGMLNDGTKMVFITAGMGGGTGTGATPVIARIAKEQGALTVGVVTKPFRFESKTRMNNALAGIEKLKESVDTLIVIPNDKLLEIVDRRTTMPEALKKADEVLQQGIQGITDLINVPSLINLDFADVQTVMTDKGIAHIGIGQGRGDDKALEAVKQAVASPLLETTIAGASHVIINVSGDITLMDAADAAEYVQELAGEDANIIFGAMYDDSRADEATITVIATGLHNVGGSASKLKSRLENQGRSSAMPHGQQGHASAYERPTRQNNTMYTQQQTVRTQQAERPVSPRLDFGTTTQRENGGTTARRPIGGTTPTLDTPRTPTSKVKEQSIKIPDFFKK